MQELSGKFGKFRQLPRADKWLFLRAVFWLSVARIRLAVTPFRRLVERLAEQNGAHVAEADPEYAERVGYAVRAAAVAVPWRSDCFPQAIAAQSLLGTQGYATTIHLGVENAGADDIAGHAWLTCGGVVVTGGGELERYTEMHRISA